MVAVPPSQAPLMSHQWPECWQHPVAFPVHAVPSARATPCAPVLHLSEPVAGWEPIPFGMPGDLGAQCGGSCGSTVRAPVGDRVGASRAGGPPAATQRPPGAQWEDSQLFVHQAEAERRAQKKRDLLRQELERQEAEECTFTPRLAPASRRCASASAGSSLMALDMELHRRARQEHLRKISDEMYAEVTGRPQITPFAKAQAKEVRESREAEAAQEGRRVPDVWERLYRIAESQRILREQRRLAREQVLIAEAAGQTMSRSSSAARSDSGTGGASSAAARRRQSSTPTSAGVPAVAELLYRDALERRDRQRFLAAHVNGFEDAERRTAVQLQGTSRRYYWQMLERQIKAAFDAATGGEGDLTSENFAEFLRAFGMLPVSNPDGDGAQSSRPAQETQTLCSALWRHLDLEGTGKTDFLTATVFFHVLMGAIDEEAQRIHSLSAAGAKWEESANKSVESPGAAVDREGQASAEEEPSVKEAPPFATSATDVDDDLVAAAEAAASAAEAADPEGRRICALLMRFNPRRLRREFHTLYLQRMHNFAVTAGLSASTRSAEPVPTHSQSVELSTQSRTLAERAEKRTREAADAQGHPLGDSYFDLIHWRHVQAEQKREQLRESIDALEAQECTFRPSIGSAAGKRAKSAEALRHVPAGQRLFAMSTGQQEEREAKAAAAEAQRLCEELADCTFTPDIRKSGRGPRSRPTSPFGCQMMPRGFTDCTQRLRKAFAAQASKRRFLDDRFHPGSPRALAEIASKVVEASAAAAMSPEDRRSRACREDRSPQIFGWSPVLLAPPPTPLCFVDGSRHSTSPRVYTPISHEEIATSLHDSQAAPAAPSAAGSATPRRDERGWASPARPQEPLAVPDAGACEVVVPWQRAAEAEIAAPVPREPLAARPAVRRGGATPRERPADRRGALPGRAPSNGRVARVLAQSARGPQPSAKVPMASPMPRAPAMPLSVPERAPPPARPSEPVARPGLASPRAPSEPARPRPLVFAEVNIAPGRPPQKLVLMEGQRLDDAAADFAAKHNLTPKLAQRLCLLLQDLLTSMTQGQ